MCNKLVLHIKNVATIVINVEIHHYRTTRLLK